jgi:type III secretion protein J
MTKQSVGLFRLIFYAFILGIFILACALAFLVWKFYPILAAEGKQLFLNPRQISKESLRQEPPVEEPPAAPPTVGGAA